jgi:hypothetical protein
MKILQKYQYLFYPTVFLVFLWPYGFSGQDFFGVWKFLIATLLITLCAIIYYPKNWSTVLGFTKNPLQIIICLVIGIIAYNIFGFIIVQKDYQFLELLGPVDYSFPTLAHIVWRITQPLNEEIVLRAMLLCVLAKLFKQRTYIAIIAALVFSILHFVLYYFGALNTALNLTSLATLFLFGLVANSLYFTFNHIGYGLVLHIAWNWWRFSGAIVKDNIVLNEAQGFNVIEGSLPVFLFVAIVGTCCLIGLRIHEVRKVKNKLDF